MTLIQKTIKPGDSETKDPLVKRVYELLQRMPDMNTREALEHLSKEDIVVWSMTNRRLRGLPLTYDNTIRLTESALSKLKAEVEERQYYKELRMRLLRHRPFQIEPLRDQHPHKVYEKGRQVGVSEMGVSEVAWFLQSRTETCKWVYTFPRDKQLSDFSTTRIAEMFGETPRMKRLLTTSNVGTKKIGNGYLLLRSAWESNLGEGIDADGVTFDEKDRMKEGVEVAFRESLSSSKYGYLREVSTPTLPGRGVDASFIKSDQRVWLVRCLKCSMEQEVEFPDNVIQVRDIPLGCLELPEGTYEYQCRKPHCRGPLDRLRGRWQAKRPEVQNIRGYHMPQTIACWISATELMQKKINYKFYQLWANYVLGQPSKGTNVLLTDLDFDRASTSMPLLTRRTRDWDTVTAGVDWGNTNWVVVHARNVHNGRRYLIGMGMFEDDPSEPLAGAKKVANYLEAFNPDLIIADHGFGKDRNAFMLRKFGVGRFYACNYNPASKGSRMFTPSWSNPDAAKVVVDRAMTIKVTAASMRDLDFGLPTLEDPLVQLFKRHFMNLRPILILDDDDEEPVEDVQAVGEDHLAHACCYSYLALDQLLKTGVFNFDFV